MQSLVVNTWDELLGWAEDHGVELRLATEEFSCGNIWVAMRDEEAIARIYAKSYGFRIEKF